jgi:transcriptional regulator with XRE-family HTH domain
MRDGTPSEITDYLARLGQNIRTARLRRKLRIADVAERMGVSRFTLADVEKGNPTTSAVAYVGALWALGLLDHTVALADPDRDDVGKALESARQPKRAARPRALDNDF